MNDTLIRHIEGLTDTAHHLFETIADGSRDGPGITRSAYGPEETKAGSVLAEFAASEGLDAGTDGVGNFRYDLPGHDNERRVVMGSHLDSVPLGGNYDGLAGVVAGVIVQAACKRAGVVPSHGWRTLGFRGEESPWFGTAYLGSKLALGLLTGKELEELTHVHSARSLAAHMAELGAATDDATIQANKLRPEQIKAYLELHIEQGPVLESLGVPIGIATAVRGNIRHPFARCLGAYSHSSASPRDLRSDAVIATARLAVATDERWARLLGQGGNDDLITNFGVFSTNAKEHAMTKVPGEVSFSMVLAGTNDDVLQQFYQDILADAQEIEAACRVRFDFGPKVGTAPVALHAGMMEQARQLAQDLGLATHHMPTVGHDAAMFARLGVPSGMILVRNQHGSHNTQESMEMEDFIEACKLLAFCALRV